MKAVYFILTILTGVCFLFSCETEYIRFDDEGTYIIDTTSPIDTVHFQNEIIPILTNNCASCHFSGTNFDMESEGVYDVLINGNWLNFADPDNSPFFQEPDPGHADDYLTIEEHTLIVKWIEQGALNN